MGLQARALMLSKFYEPLEVVSWQKAMTLLFTGHARVVEEYEDQVVHSATHVYRVPSVIQHVSATLRHERPVRFSRANVYARDGFACAYCGVKHGFTGLTFDHVVPKSRGGKKDWLNIATCCVKCNKRKGNRTPEEAGMRLLKVPKRPRYSPAGLLAVNHSFPASWDSFLKQAA